MKNVFNPQTSTELVDRINKLTPNSERQWGKMTVAQMLAHCSVTYEFVYEDIHPLPNPIMRLLLKLFVKNSVVNEVPYKKNLKTAPEFIIKETKDFETEKNRLINYIKRTQELGEKYFDNKESRSFGKLSVTEWNNMFYKHLDHLLQQFGV